MKIWSRSIGIGFVLAGLAVSFASVSQAANSPITVAYSPAKAAGSATCGSKYPATGKLGAAFRHGLQNACYSCPAGYKRSLNPNINASDACVRVTLPRTVAAKASYRGKKTTPKPSGAFFDPRKGGEWWKCPSNRPRRTAYAVTDKRACATKNIIGEKLSSATFMGKVNNPMPNGAFFDPRNGGEYWSCPANYKRSAAPVTAANACVRGIAGSTRKAKATSRGAPGCPKGAFRNGLWTGCYTCPSGYSRSLAIGSDLTKLKNACFKATVDTRSLRNPEFLRWAKEEAKKIRQQYGPAIEQAVRMVGQIASRKNVDAVRNAKSVDERERISRRLMSPMLDWAKSRARKASIEFRDPPGGEGVQVAATGGPAAFQVAAVDRTKDYPESYDAFPSISLGWTIDASLVVGMTATPQFFAWDTTASRNGMDKGQLYNSIAWSIGVTGGLDMAPEIGFWTDVNHKLAGDSHGFVIAAAVKGGIGVTYWWNYKGKFLGFTVVPQIGLSAEAEYTRGMTGKY